jgi:hypothetical protein
MQSLVCAKILQYVFFFFFFFFFFFDVKCSLRCSVAPGWIVLILAESQAIYIWHTRYIRFSRSHKLIRKCRCITVEPHVSCVGSWTYGPIRGTTTWYLPVLWRWWTRRKQPRRAGCVVDAIYMRREYNIHVYRVDILYAVALYTLLSSLYKLLVWVTRASAHSSDREYTIIIHNACPALLAL